MNNKGGDGGEVYLATRELKGDGKISADGGDGENGGKGGKVTIVSDKHDFVGEISARGGKSLLQNDDLKKAVNQLTEAVNKKDKNSIIKILSYIGDKSLDVLLALLVKRL